MANQPSKYSKFLVGAASAALVASAVAPVASAADFKDTKGNTHEEAINALSDAGVISGYPDGTFLPNKTLSRSDVVKLMGKWLVAEGAVVPTDYKTNPRFADLKSTSNDELLKFAAVVKDNGVFVGTPDGKLDPTGNITRENMAVVLVRAFDRVHEIDLTTYVAGQDFKKDVTDLGTAKAEARPAIEVLDFFDITNPAAPAFNPKSTTTRGQFATFLYKTTKTDFSDVTTGVVGSADIKAVNATTVEVTFKDSVENLNSLNFKIDGLTVSNAAVKQSNDKVVVLTTAVQKGGEKYTVTLNEKAIGSFTGVSAVIPTTINITTQSVQGKVGAQAILSADVGIKEAGIPVTFNVKANTIGTLNKDQVFEAVTNADGIATFSYTQYAAGTDSVVAYPTGSPTVRSLGYVFWGVDTILAVEEVTTGASINNGANKTYKVTYKNASTGKVEANKTFNVSVLENIGVTADKLQDVTVNGVKVAQLSNNTKTEAAQITTDSKGEATFTVSGTNAEATPVVFEAHNTTSNGVVTSDFKYEASELQATAAKVKFGAVQSEYKIDVTRDGGEVAATGEANGREYKVLVKDKDGKVAKNETVNVAFNEDLDRVISTNTKSKFVNPDTDTYYPTTSTGNTSKLISVKTDDKGEAKFVIATDTANENDYATPVAWIDINTSNARHGSLDEGEPKTVAGITHFQKAYLDGAKIVAKLNGAGKAITKFDGADKAVFSAELVNQSNKVFTEGYSIEKVTYTVFNTGAEDVIVDNVTISPNRSESFTKAGSLTVESVGQKTTSVRVVATGTAKKDGKDFIFTAKEATATFTNSKAVPTPFTGLVTEFNPADSGANSNSLWFDGKNPIKYTGTNVKYFGANGNEIFGEAAWETYLTSLATAVAPGNDVTVSYSKVGDDTLFKVITVATGTAKKITKTAAPIVVAPTTGVVTLTSSSASTTLVDSSALENLAVQLADADLNVNKAGIDTTTVAISDGTNPALTLTLVETGVDTGVFTTTVQSGTLNSLAAGVLTVTYADAKNVSGNAESITKTITFKNAAGVLSVPTFTQAVLVAPATAAEYTSKSIDPAYTFATGETFSIKIDAGAVLPVTLLGKTGAQGVADAINAVTLATATATVVGDKVVVKTTSATGATSTIDVSLTTVSQVLNGSAAGTPATGPAASATSTFAITTALVAGEKVVIDGESYALVASGVNAQATELFNAINANASSAFTATNGVAGQVILTAKATGVITAPVVKVTK